MRDIGHEETERLIRRMEREVSAVYKQAAEETQEKLADYFRRFEIKDKKWKLMVESGERTKEQYTKWREQQILVGERWKALNEQLAADYHNANVIARDIALGYRSEAYALNMNYGTFLVERQAKVNTSFTLYNRESVERIIKKQPELLPPPGKQMKKTLRENPDIAWQKGQIQSVTTQAIVQGESIPNMSKRIARTMGEINHGATIRYARTAMTGAQNAGRIDAFHRAEELGINIKQKWIATLDGRTRYEHRQLDGVSVPVGEDFEVDGYRISFPGDPTAAPEMIWNCRCTMIADIEGLSPDTSRRALDESLGDISYDDWKNDHKSISHSITKQEEIAEAMKWKYINEDYKK